MFECMEFAETIDEGVVEPSYLKNTRADANCDGHSRQKRGESASSKIYFEMGKYTGKRNEMYVDRQRY